MWLKLRCLSLEYIRCGGGREALPAAWKSWEEGGARFLSGRFRAHRYRRCWLLLLLLHLDLAGLEGRGEGVLVAVG